MTLVDLVVEVHDHLAGSGMRHAFGGALALSFVIEPRATVDVDLNVFLPVDQAGVTIDLLASLELQPQQPAGVWMPAAGIRLHRAGTPYPVDLFLSIDPDVYDAIAGRVVWHPFGPEGRRLPFLSPEDLVTFKLSFGRPKDWVDLEQIATQAVPLDLDLVESTVVALRGPTIPPAWRGCAR